MTDAKDTVAPDPSILSGYRDQTEALGAKESTLPESASALNEQIVGAVQTTNAQTIQNMPAMIIGQADTMIAQAAGLAAQSSVSYFDSMTKVVLASQSVMLQKLTEDVANGDVQKAEIDAVGIVVTEVLLAGAMAVAAAGGAMEAKSASASIDMINTALEKLNSKPSGED